MRNKIGESLIRAGLISPDALQDALTEQTRTGERLGVVLVRMKLATEDQIAEALAAQLGFPYVRLAGTPPDPSAVGMIPRELALEGVCVAIRLDDQTLTVAMADPLVFSLVNDLETRTGYRLKPVVSTPAEIFKAIAAGYPDHAHPGHPGLRTDADEAATTQQAAGPVNDVRSALTVDEIVDLAVKGAVQGNASAVHLDPVDGRAFIRQRVDGTLRDLVDFPGAIHDEVVAKLKNRAGMDVMERRLSQEGRLRVRDEAGVGVDLRVSTLLTLHGERIVIRAADDTRSAPSLTELGLSPTALKETRRLLRLRQGLVLVVGPAGSGRSTTLAAAVVSMRTLREHIVTIEDFVAYRLPGVSQTEINAGVGVTYVSALHAALRQVPGVVLVGELRDGATASAALQAAESGHLILSTLCAEDAPSGVARLIDRGIEPSAVAGALVGVVAQRLVRRLCPHCRRRYTPSLNALQTLGMSEADASAVVFYEAVGCDQCSHTGYRGRVGLFEVMRITDSMRRLIAARGTEDQIRQAASDSGMVSLGEDGLAKMKTGLTTPEELFRAVAEIRDPRALCRACGTAVAIDFKACPACGTRLGGCPHCGRALQPGWNFCPYCTRSVTEGQPAPRVSENVRDQRPKGRRTVRPGKIAEFKK